MPSCPLGYDLEAVVAYRHGETFENCIASTKVKVFLFYPSYKGLTVDALALGAEEGRGRLRKASVSCQASFDPGMSELGNQAGVMPSHSGLNT